MEPKTRIQWPLFIMLSVSVFARCAALEQTPAVAVHSSQLACPDAPQIVDGNLENQGNDAKMMRKVSVAITHN